MLIEVQHLTKRFGAESAVNDISFQVDAGERIALIGRNGAGKTTLLRLLATFLPPTSGSASVHGFDLLTQANAIRAITGYLPENSPLYPEMTVSAYLRFRGKLRRMPSAHLKRRIHEVIDFCGLAYIRDTPIGRLSAGQRQAVGLADAILHEPDVLLFDDPLNAADPDQAAKFIELISSPIVSAGRAIFFSTHRAELICEAATRVICLDRGTVLTDTTDLAPFREKPLSELFRIWKTAADLSL